MSQKERTGPVAGAGPDSDGETLAQTVPAVADIPPYPRGGDPRRRHRLAQLFNDPGRRNRPTTGEPIDYRATGLDLGWPERQARGDELLALGWTP